MAGALQLLVSMVVLAVLVVSVVLQRQGTQVMVVTVDPVALVTPVQMQRLLLMQ
jgi:hypothetical protein